jgi:hypothetical protein
MANGCTHALVLDSDDILCDALYIVNEAWLCMKRVGSVTVLRLAIADLKLKV